MTLALSTTTRTAFGTAIITAIGTSGFVDIYNGTRPASGGTATTLLVHLPLSATSAVSTTGVLTFNAITTTNAAATGTATWFRVTTSGGTFVIDGDVGTSGADLNLNTSSIVSGGPVAISSFTITSPNA